VWSLVAPVVVTPRTDYPIAGAVCHKLTFRCDLTKAFSHTIFVVRDCGWRARDLRAQSHSRSDHFHAVDALIGMQRRAEYIMTLAVELPGR
jgi:hypothetical protein